MGNEKKQYVTVDMVRKANDELMWRKNLDRSTYRSTYAIHLTAAEITAAFKKTMEELQDNPERQAIHNRQQELLASLLSAKE